MSTDAADLRALTLVRLRRLDRLYTDLLAEFDDELRSTRHSALLRHALAVADEIERRRLEAQP